MTTSVVNQEQAISIATEYLNRLLSRGAPPSHVSARYVSDQDIVCRRSELAEFFSQNGQSDGELLQEQVDRMGLRRPHWSVQFYAIDKPNTASTTPPTIVRVYDSDGNVELAE